MRDEPEPVVAVVALHTEATALRREVERAGFAVRLLPCSPLAPLRREYRSASVGIVAGSSTMRVAAILRRTSRVPWVALLGPKAVDPRRTRSAAGLLVAREGDAPSTGRVVAWEDTARLESLLRDVALATDARGAASWLSALPDALLFVNDRAHRLAIRLVRWTGKATAPLHPKHLVEDPRHFWYADELRPSDRLLDVGCGNGVHTLRAAARVAAAVGVDVDERTLADARSQAAAQEVSNVRFVRGDLADPATMEKIGEGGFDVVLALDVLEHVWDRSGLLHSLAKSLQSEGRLLLSVPRRDTPYKRWRRRFGGFAYSDPDHKIEYSEETLRRELEGAGFHIFRIERAGYDTPFGGLAALVGGVWLAPYEWIVRRRFRLAEQRPDSASAFRVRAVRREPVGER